MTKGSLNLFRGSFIDSSGGSLKLELRAQYISLEREGKRLNGKILNRLNVVTFTAITHKVESFKENMKDTE